jgi:hypothetical protein
MNDYIAKPVKSTTMAAALEKWLPRKAGEEHLDHPMN